jgi:hypothetical protein
MDDILIATLTITIMHTGKLVNKSWTTTEAGPLYLKPAKCEFEVRRIEFLGVILENGTVTMDPIKVLE